MAASGLSARIAHSIALSYSLFAVAIILSFLIRVLGLTLSPCMLFSCVEVATPLNVAVLDRDVAAELSLAQAVFGVTSSV